MQVNLAAKFKLLW